MIFTWTGPTPSRVGQSGRGADQHGGDGSLTDAMCQCWQKTGWITMVVPTSPCGDRSSAGKQCPLQNTSLTCIPSGQAGSDKLRNCSCGQTANQTCYGRCNHHNNNNHNHNMLKWVFSVNQTRLTKLMSTRLKTLF